ncbi:hypothetical protein N656DRAFT_794064 [Canariomyces notabilis]|uniref:Protein kinase domain-containing protein n=1 Tax=Canariomyces notabilis TaxID=2074819 RepID=A0AAN6YXQ0_9PEZI|nr:hypothetical protein N656DRAFT_794064 [Canariomyces arenarius]
MKLLAVGWEIQRGRIWYLGKTTRVWPILIFEKAGLGTLGDFMKSDQGKALSLEDRGKICCDIASAIAFSHRKGIFLMFEENGPVPKLADFGFAAFASNKLIEIAKLSDIFSFEILCLWVLFREELVKRGEDLTKPLPPKGLVASAVTTLSGVLKPIGRVLGFVDQDVSPDIQIIGAHNTFPKETNKIKTLALELVSGLPHTVWKERLEQLFMSALDTDTEKRAQSVEYLMRFLGNQSPADSFTLIRRDSAGESDRRDGSSAYRSFPTASSFDILKSLQTPCSADFRLAVCKQIGFGTSRDPEQAALHLKEAKELQQLSSSFELAMDETNLLSQIKQSSSLQKPSNEKLSIFYRNGIIAPIHQGIDMTISSPETQEKIIGERRAEIERMESALGRTHPAIINLKWTLLSLLEMSHDPLAPIDFAHEMAKVLEQDEDYGPQHRDALLVKGYRSLSFMRIMPQGLPAITSRLKETEATLAQSSVKDHVVTSIVRVALADCLAVKGYHIQAEELLQQVGPQLIAMFGPNHPNTVSCSKGQLTVYCGRGNSLKALIFSNQQSRTWKP